jgi:hypothetical protein
MKILLSFCLLPAYLVLFALSGCSKPKCYACDHPRPQGTLAPAAAQAQVASVRPASIVAVSPDMVTGVNLTPTIAKVSVQANDMVWVATDALLYLSVASANDTNPNTITSLDPKTGQFGASATTSGEPGKLTVSPDGTYLYASVNSTFSVRCFSLPSLQFESDMPLTPGVRPKSQLDATTDLGGELQLDATTGNLYSNTGKVFDTSTGVILGSFPLNALQGGFSEGSALMVPDGKLNIGYFLGHPVDSAAGTYVIEAFDLTRFHLLNAISIPDVSGVPSKFVRWGDNGLAFLTTGGTNASANGLYIVSGGFVTSPAP